MVDCPKDLHVSASKATPEIPPVVAAAISLKTIIGEKRTTNEVVSASIICCHKAKVLVALLKFSIWLIGVSENYFSLCIFYYHLIMLFENYSW